MRKRPTHVVPYRALTRRRFLQLVSAAGTFAASAHQTSSAAVSATVNRHLRLGSPEAPLAGPWRGHWRRLFLDAAVVEQQEGLSRIFHAAEKHPANPVLRADRPWEAASAITGPYVYGTVMREDGKFRLWYQILNKGNHVGYAESDDGVHWIKPDLGIIEFNGSKANNLVVSAFQPAVTDGECHNPSVICCPEQAESRFALYGFDPQAGHARVAFSADGLHWRYVAETEKKPLFTSSDVVNFFYDPYHQRYTATWKTRNRRGRAVGVAWSDDGLAWTKPVDGPVFVADDLDPDATQIYGMPVFPYQGLYIGQPWIYSARYFKYGDYSVNKLHDAQEDSPRTVEVQLAWSWDLINWTRPHVRTPFIAHGAKAQWDSGMIYTARAPVVVGEKLYFYYGGCDALHDDRRVNAAIGLAALRLDGFCSLQAGETEGWFISRREPMRKPLVNINARTGNGGFVVAEILDRQNRVVPGFSREDCTPFTGDSVSAVLKWTTARLPTPLAADYKLRFYMRNADLFSYFPAALDSAQPDLARF